MKQRERHASWQIPWCVTAVAYALLLANPDRPVFALAAELKFRRAEAIRERRQTRRLRAAGSIMRGTPCSSFTIATSKLGGWNCARLFPNSRFTLANLRD